MYPSDYDLYFSPYIYYTLLQVDYADTTYLSVATYSCHEGHELQGEAVVTCEASGQWQSSVRPVCSPISCDAPVDIVGATYNTNVTEFIYRYTTVFYS